MKKFYILSLCLLLGTISFSACDEEKVITSSNEETVTLGFNIKADLDISEMPLEATRAGGTSKTYAVQVYEYSSNTNSLLPYAYGIFDDVSKMSITMRKSKTYKIYIGLFLDFFDKYKFGGPYYGASPYYTAANNEFVYSQEWIFPHWWTNLAEGAQSFYLTSDSEASQSMLECDSYCGIIDEFKATDNDVIEAQLARSAFGIQINVSGMTEGKLVWEGCVITPYVRNSYEICSIEYPETRYEQMFTIVQFLRSTMTEEEDLQFYLYYYDSSNNKQILAQNSITIHRNKKKLINITLQSTSNTEVSRSFSISTSQDTMEEEELTYTFEINQ